MGRNLGVATWCGRLLATSAKVACALEVERRGID